MIHKISAPGNSSGLEEKMALTLKLSMRLGSRNSTSISSFSGGSVSNTLTSDFAEAAVPPLTLLLATGSISNSYSAKAITSPLTASPDLYALYPDQTLILTKFLLPFHGLPRDRHAQS